MGLEKHLGYPLFSRRNKDGVRLTRKGEELFGVIENVYFNVKRYTSRNTLQVGQKRKIRIASHHTLLAYLINDLVLEYNKDHPELLFEVIGVNQNIDAVLHDVDIAIQAHDPHMDSINWQIIQEPFLTLKKKLYASRQYLEKHGEPKTIDDAYENLKLDKDINEKLDPAFLSNTLECLIEAAQKGNGIVALYNKMKAFQQTHLQNVLPDVTISTHQEYLVYPEYLKDDKDIMDLRDYLMKATKNRESSG